MKLLVTVGFLKKSNGSEWGAQSFPHPWPETNQVSFLSEFGTFK